MHKTIVAAALLAASVVTPAFAACDTINSKTLTLSACIDGSDWVLQAPQGDQEFLYFSADERVAFTVITEADTFSPTDLRHAILVNAGNATNGSEPQATGERNETVGGTTWNVLEYEVDIEGQPLAFQNFYYTGPGYGSVQLVFWSAPEDARLAAYRAGRLLTTVSQSK